MGTLRIFINELFNESFDTSFIEKYKSYKKKSLITFLFFQKKVSKYFIKQYFKVTH